MTATAWRSTCGGSGCRLRSFERQARRARPAPCHALALAAQAKTRAWIKDTEQLNRRIKKRTTAFLSLPADYNPFDYPSLDPERADQASVEYLRFEHVVRFMTLDRNEDRVIDREESLRTDPFAEN